MRHLVWSFLAVSIVMVSPSRATEPTALLPLIRNDESGKVLVTDVSASRYSRNLAELIQKTSSAVQPALARLGQNSGFRVRTVMVGVGLNVSAGAGTLIELAATPRFRLGFSNSKDPVIP